MVETSGTASARPEATISPANRYQLRPRSSPTSVKSAPVQRRSPRKFITPAATPAVPAEVAPTPDTLDQPFTQPASSTLPPSTPATSVSSLTIPETSASPLTILSTSASPITTLLASAPSPIIHSQAIPLPLDQPVVSSASIIMATESQQGSLSFNVEQEHSASTAPFMSLGTTASVPVQPARSVAASVLPTASTVELVQPAVTAPVQPVVSAPVTTGPAEHLDRFLAEAAGPWSSTPLSERSTPATASDPWTRRALLFSAGQGSSTPAVDAAQGVPMPSVAGTSVAPSQTSCTSTEFRQLLHLKDQQLLLQGKKMLEQEAELQKYLDKQLQMEQLLQQLQKQVQQAAAVAVQPSITIARINPQPVVSTATPTTVNQSGMRGNVRSQTLPATVLPEIPMSAASIQPVSHVSLPQHMTAARDMWGQTVSDRMPVSVPGVAAFPVSYAAVVQPTLIPPAVVRPVQPAAHLSAPHVGSTAIPAVSAFPAVGTVTSTSMPFLSTVDLVSDQQSDGPSVTLQDIPASDFL